MQTTTTYQAYLKSMENYEISQARKDFQAPYAEDFEAIYSQAKSDEISVSNAKEYLSTLSADELKTLQNYSGLADSINVDTITPEGAYNLLLHDKEHYDFNNDGVAEVGAAQTMPLVPTNMPTDVRDAYITAINALQGADKLMVSMLFNSAHLNAALTNEQYKPTTIDYNYLKAEVDKRLNPVDGGYTSPEAKSAITTFWNVFNSAYTGDKTEVKEEEERSSEIIQFLKDLRTKGAAQFLSDLNLEKIEKLVEEYKKKLLESMGDSPEALEEIAKLVDNYRTQLLEEMHEKTKEEAKTKPQNNTAISKDTVVQELIDLQQDKRKTSLEDLLA